jgi:hypothetical protein
MRNFFYDWEEDLLFRAEGHPRLTGRFGLQCLGLIAAAIGDFLQPPSRIRDQEIS